MLKRLGLAGLVFATLAVTPLTVVARDRNGGRGANNWDYAQPVYTQSRYAQSRYAQSRYDTGRSGGEQARRSIRDDNRHRFGGRDGYDHYRADSHRDHYDYR